MPAQGQGDDSAGDGRTAVTGREFRMWQTGCPEYRAGEGDVPPAISGLATPYGRYSVNLGGFVEQFAPGAFAESLAKGNDIWVDFQHDERLILGRTGNQTAEFWEEADGVHYRALLNPGDPDAARVGAKVGRGDVAGSSIVFSVLRLEDEEWDLTDDGFPVRTILRARLWAAGPVVNPAYLDTSVEAKRALRRLAEVRSLPPGRVEEAAADGSLRELIFGETTVPVSGDGAGGDRETPTLDRRAVAYRLLGLKAAGPE